MKPFKKIIKSIKKFFRIIARIIDKIIVTPITKFGLFISEKFDKGAGKFEKWISKRNTMIFVSLLLAILFFFYVDNQASTIIDSAAEVLENQEVVATYNKEAYIVEGLPETADVTLIGRTVDLYLAKQLSTGKVTADLSNLKAGTHRIDLNYQNAINSVSYKLNPSTITVNVYEKVSATKGVTIDVINQDKLNSRLAVQSVTFISLNELSIYVTYLLYYSQREYEQFEHTQHFASSLNVRSPHSGQVIKPVASSSFLISLV